MNVLVVGGGISGLVAAYELGRAGVPVTLIEAGPRLGGKVGTEHVEGYVVERGPDSFLVGKPAAVQLCRDLGLAGALVPPRSPSDVFVWHGRLVPVPEGLGSGIPRAFRPVALSPLFCLREKLGLARELFVPPGTVSGDEPVGAFLRRRFGDALVDRLASPLLEGVYGTPVDELSLLALLPHLREAERRHGSLLRAALFQARTVRVERAPGPPTLSLAGGMGSLVDALAERTSHTEIILDTAVVRLERAAPGYRALLGDGRWRSFGAVIVATPTRSTASLLADIAPGAASALADMPYGSTAVVSLGYREDQLAHPLAGHGFLVPPGALAISACTWSSSKWPGRAPDGSVLLRASVRAPRLLATDDASLVEAVHAALASVLGVRGRPELARVARHPGIMPRYTVGHLERVAAIDAALADEPRVQVIGAAYRGAGIPECIAQGRSAAAALVALAVAGDGDNVPASVETGEAAVRHLFRAEPDA